MREVIMTGKTVEEATELALAELGLPAEEVTVEVIDLPQRRLFKSIPAKVRATADTEEAVVPAEPEKVPAQKEKAPEKAEKKASAAPKASEQPDRKDPVQAAKSAAEKENDTFEEPAQMPIDLEQDEKARAAVQYLTEVCALMGAPNITVTPVCQGETTILKVEGESAGTLIGHRGEVMEALSYLTSLVANRAGGDYRKVGLDINHYRSKREANLTALARRIGAKVARTGRGHTLEPMNPYERRIIHSAISEMEGVKSESIGEGANRRVVISSTNPNTRPPREGRGGRPGEKRGGRGGDKRGGRGPRREGDWAPRTGTPEREFADKPRDPHAQPTVPVRTETINDGADLPLYGKIEL